MRYKLVVKNKQSVYVKEYNRIKEALLEKAELLSRKHPHWIFYVVRENVFIE